MGETRPRGVILWLAGLAGLAVVLVLGRLSSVTLPPSPPPSAAPVSPVVPEDLPDQVREGLASLPTPEQIPPWWVATVDGRHVRLTPLAGGRPERVALPAPVAQDVHPQLLRVGDVLVVHTEDGTWRVDPRAPDKPAVRLADTGALLPADRPDAVWLLRPGPPRGASLVTLDGDMLFDGLAPFSPSLALAPDRLVGQGRDDYGIGSFTWSASDATIRSAGGGEAVGAAGARLLWCSAVCASVLVHHADATTRTSPRIDAPPGVWFVPGSGVADPMGRRVAVLTTAADGPGTRGVAVIDVDAGTMSTVLSPVRETRERHRLAWTPDGRDLAIGRRDGTLLLWHVDDQQLSQLAVEPALPPERDFALVEPPIRAAG